MRMMIIRYFIIIFAIATFLAGCGEKDYGSPLKPSEVVSILNQKGYLLDIKDIKPPYGGNYEDRLYTVECKKENNEDWVVVLWPSGKTLEQQLGVSGLLSREQMIGKIKTIRSVGLVNNLTLKFSSKGEFVWTYPDPLDEKNSLNFNIRGELLSSIQANNI